MSFAPSTKYTAPHKNWYNTDCMNCHTAHRYVHTEISPSFGTSAVGFSNMQTKLINSGYYKSHVLDNITHLLANLFTFNEGR